MLISQTLTSWPSALLAIDPGPLRLSDADTFGIGCFLRHSHAQLWTTNGSTDSALLDIRWKASAIRCPLLNMNLGMPKAYSSPTTMDLSDGSTDITFLHMFDSNNTFRCQARFWPWTLNTCDIWGCTLDYICFLLDPTFYFGPT